MTKRCNECQKEISTEQDKLTHVKEEGHTIFYDDESSFHKRTTCDVSDLFKGVY